MVVSNLTLQTTRLADIQDQLAGQDEGLGRLVDEYRGLVLRATLLRGQMATQMQARAEWKAVEKDRRTAVDQYRGAQHEYREIAGLAAADDAELVRGLDSMTRAKSDAARAEEDMLRMAHDLSYGDPALARLRKEIKQLESEINRRHAAIVERAQVDPSWREARKMRQATLAQLSSMRAQEQVLQREIQRVATGMESDSVPVEAR